MTEKKQKNTSKPRKKKIDKFKLIEKERDDYKNLAQRTQADLINSRNRMLKQIEETEKRNTKKIVLEFLTLLDDLELALSSMDENGWKEGIRVIQSKFINTLDSLGVSVIKEKLFFDPRFHEAVLVSSDKNKKPGEIARVFRAGYTLDEEVIRPVQVEIIRDDVIVEGENKKN